jgi:hypothetical protein
MGFNLANESGGADQARTEGDLLERLRLAHLKGEELERQTRERNEQIDALQRELDRSRDSEAHGQ